MSVCVCVCVCVCVYVCMCVCVYVLSPHIVLEAHSTENDWGNMFNQYAGMISNNTSNNKEEDGGIDSYFR